MDHITEDAAQVAWQHADRRIRTLAATWKLNELRKLASLMRRNDAQDAARAIWLEFIDGQTPVEAEKLDAPAIADQARILAGVAWHLTERDIVGFARAAWGGMTFDAHAAADTHLGWYPDDETVVIKRTVLNGATTVLMLTPSGIQGRVL